MAGKLRIAIEEVYSPISVPRVVAEARKRGLRVEVLASSKAVYRPYNTITKQQVIIEDEELSRRSAAFARRKLG